MTPSKMDRGVRIWGLGSRRLPGPVHHPKRLVVLLAMPASLRGMYRAVNDGGERREEAQSIASGPSLGPASRTPSPPTLPQVVRVVN